jgi:hypothetical protein
LQYPSDQEVYAMSDNLRRYRAIHQALKQWYPGEPSGRLAQHLTTLAAFISGIVGSKSSQLPSIATKVPDRAKPDSRVKRLSRWLDNDAILEEVYFLPYAEMLLHHLAFETLVLVMDGSGVGRGCCALMMHVIYQGRALPLAWRVRQCPKGHFPEDLHIAVVELVRELIPEGTKVVFLGDGEFDGIKLQETMHEAGWWYACRTSHGNTATWEDETFHVEELGACLKPGRLIELKAVALTRAAYGRTFRTPLEPLDSILVIFWAFVSQRRNAQQIQQLMPVTAGCALDHAACRQRDINARSLVKRRR